MNKLEGTLFAAVCTGDCQEAKRILSQNPELLYMTSGGKSLLHFAAQKNKVAIMELLVNNGLPVDILKRGSDEGALENDEYETASTALSSALFFNRKESAEWLLANGANPNDGIQEERWAPIFNAIQSGSLEMVKLLVDHGADLDAASRYKDVVYWAEVHGTPDIVEYLQSLGLGQVTESQDNSAIPQDYEEEQFLNYLDESVGPFLEQAIVPIVGTTTIMVSPPGEDKDHCTLVTSGMRHRRMNVPLGEEEFAHAELCINLPADWPLTNVIFEKPETSWPIEWLLRIADYPEDNNTWLGGDIAIIHNENPPEPIASGLGFTCMLLAEGASLEPFTREDGAQVVFYTLYPIYTEEMEFEKTHDSRKLIEKFMDCGWTMVVDPDRPNVCVSTE